MTNKLLHEFPSTSISYDELMIELNKVKSQLPKDLWKNINFEVELKLELGTYYEYKALSIYLRE